MPDYGTMYFTATGQDNDVASWSGPESYTMLRDVLTHVYATRETSNDRIKIEFERATVGVIETLYLNYYNSRPISRVMGRLGSNTPREITSTRTEISTIWSMTEDITLDWLFYCEGTPSRTISCSVTPSSAGYTTGQGEYYDGDSCTVTATANRGYEFQKWTDGGTTVSTNPSYTFTVTGNRTLVAVFVETTWKYIITATARPSAGGTVTGGGEYEEGSSCTVTATVNSGWVFKYWEENGAAYSYSNPYSFPVNRDRNLVAVFGQPAEVFASAAPEYGGTVTGSGRYVTGDRVTMTATANQGYMFQGWKESGQIVSTDNPWVFAIEGNRYLYGTFTSDKRTINVQASPSEGGTVSGGGEYFMGETVTIAAAENEGYRFVNWKRSGEVVSTDKEYTFTVTESVTYVATFAIRMFNITAYADPADGGTTEVESPQVQIHGSTKVRATPNSGYNFLNWTEAGEVIDTRAQIYLEDITSDRVLTAHFTTEPVLHHYKVIFDDNGGSGGPGTYETDDEAEQMTLTVPSQIPTKEGNAFTGWLVEGTTQILQPGDTATIRGDVVYTLIAQWSSTDYHYTVHFDGVKEEATDIPEDIEEDSPESVIDITLPNNVPQCEGFTFAGWLDDITGRTFQPGDVYTMTSDKTEATMFAQWSGGPVPPLSSSGYLWRKNGNVWIREMAVGPDDNVKFTAVDKKTGD